MSSIATLAHTGCEAVLSPIRPLRCTMPRAMFDDVAGIRLFVHQPPIVRARYDAADSSPSETPPRCPVSITRSRNFLAESLYASTFARMDTSCSVDAHNPSIWSANASTKSSKPATLVGSVGSVNCLISPSTFGA